MMPITTLNGCSCRPRVGSVGFSIGGFDVGNVLGGVLKTGLETGVKFGVQYGMNELLGGGRAPSQIQQAVAATAPQPPVVMVTQPAPSSAVNSNTLMIVGAVAVLAIVLSRR